MQSKFDKFADHPNYYKLLVDFRVYDKAGNYAPQSAVQMAFPDDFEKVVGESLTEAQATQNELDADMSSLLDEVRRELKIGQKQYSARNENWTLKAYSDKQVENWSGSKRIVVYKNDSQLMDFVDEAIKDGTFSKKMYFGIVSDELADEVRRRFGVDIQGYNCSLGGNEIRKILKDHGNEDKESLHGQRAVSKEDFAEIPYVLSKPDAIMDGGFYNGKPLYNFKRNGYTVAGVVSDKHIDLFVQTMYVSKKNRSLATATDDQASVNTSKTTSGTAPNNIIPNSEENTISQEQFSERTADSRTLLTNALDTIAQTDQEKELLAE